MDISLPNLYMYHIIIEQYVQINSASARGFTTIQSSFLVHQRLILPHLPWSQIKLYHLLVVFYTTSLRQDPNNTRCKQLHSTESGTLINNFSKKSPSISSLSRVQPSILHQYHLISTTQSQLMLLKQTLFSRNQLNKCYPNKLLPLEISQCYRHMQIHCGRYNFSESNVHE